MSAAALIVGPWHRPLALLHTFVRDALEQCEIEPSSIEVAYTRAGGGVGSYVIHLRDAGDKQLLLPTVDAREGEDEKAMLPANLNGLIADGGFEGHDVVAVFLRGGDDDVAHHTEYYALDWVHEGTDVLENLALSMLTTVEALRTAVSVPETAWGLATAAPPPEPIG
jgi:hypothetical protein